MSLVIVVYRLSDTGFVSCVMGFLSFCFFCLLFVVVRLPHVVRHSVFSGWSSVFVLLLYRCCLLFVASVYCAFFVTCFGVFALRCLSCVVCYLLFKDSRFWFSV